MTTRLLPYGPSGWLVELDAGADAAGFASVVRRAADPAVAEVVPAARTVLVELADSAASERVGEWLSGIDPAAGLAGPVHDGDVVVIRVDYDGPDLTAVAAATGLDVAGVVARHAAPVYRCAFCGFAPGFAYLSGLDPVLQLPRRPTPRTRVPAGAVAIAAAYSAVYPSASPGGWHLLGSTGAQLWDTTRQDPALIRPGAAVRFEVR